MNNIGNFQIAPFKNDLISTAIIGGGKISEQHLLSLNKLQKVNIVAICDLSPALSKFTAKRFDIPHYYTDYSKMLRDCEIDVVHVLTPPATHDQIVRDCLDSGCHVIVEKPIAISNEKFRNLYDYAVSKKLRLIENHNYRFNEPILQLEHAVKKGQIGTVKEVEVRMVLNIAESGRYADMNLPHPSHRLPAGILHEFITHMVYLTLNFIPESSSESKNIVYAAWNNHSGNPLFKYDDLDAVILFDDVHARIRFSCHQSPDCFSIKIRGTEGKGRSELFHPICQVSRQRSVGQHLTPLMNSLSAARTIRRAGYGSLWKKIQNRGAYEGLARFLEQTYNSFFTGDHPPVSFQQMDETSSLIDALLAQEKSK